MNEIHILNIEDKMWDKGAETLKMIKSVDLKETELRSIQNDIY